MLWDWDFWAHFRINSTFQPHLLLFQAELFIKKTIHCLMGPCMFRKLYFLRWQFLKITHWKYPNDFLWDTKQQKSEPREWQWGELLGQKPQLKQRFTLHGSSLCCAGLSPGGRATINLCKSERIPEGDNCPGTTELTSVYGHPQGRAHK